MAIMSNLPWKNGLATPPQNQAPKPPPGLNDYASASIYQSSDPYPGTQHISNPSPIIPPNQIHPASIQNQQPPPMQASSPTLPTHQMSANMAPIAPVAPSLNTSPTGQYSISSNSNPFGATTHVNPNIGNTVPAAGSTVFKSATKKAPAPAKHAPSALDKYLGKDTDYQGTLRDLQRALTDFKANQLTQKARAGTEYGYAKRLDEQQKTQDLSDILNDFAARGIATSGVYADRLGTYNTGYNEKLAELGRQYNNQLQDFGTQLNDFLRQQALQKEAAREAAIRRRAAQLGKIQ